MKRGVEAIQLVRPEKAKFIEYQFVTRYDDKGPGEILYLVWHSFLTLQKRMVQNAYHTVIPYSYCVVKIGISTCI